MTSTNPTIDAPEHTDLDIIDGTTSMHTLFRHTRREMWGLGIVLARDDDRVKMQFQDGRTRSFANGYYHMLDAVDRPLDLTRSVVNALCSMVDEEDAPRATGPEPVSFDEQISFFQSKYAAGFQDVEYSERHRGDGRKKPLKRQRDGLVEKAVKLQKASMAEWMKAGEYAEIHKAAKGVANVTDLVAAKERKLFASIGEEHHEMFAASLHALLHGTSKLVARMDGFIRTLTTAMGTAPSWGLASVFLGSVHPEEHVVVRGKVLALQCAWMAPGLSVSDNPMGILYERLANMTKEVKARLEAEAFEPRDMLDVTDFMWATLRPMAQKEILKVRRTTPRLTAAAGDASEQQAA
ncbi:MAG: hypothetical protein ACI9KE_002803 [Polyangiales bacterium]